jgi:predicted metal-dependent HD superfamily phosphohydrolase
MIIEPPPHLINGLRKRYGEPHRAYHNWSHIEALLKHFHAHRGLVNAPTTVLWALYWHDAIYDPSSAENERNSALLLREEASGLISTRELDDAAAIIDATAKHAVPSGLTTEQESDLKLFLDIDLSILGQRDEVFDDYEAAIRQEYSFVPLELYKAGRISILQGFLNRDRLFFTDTFHELWEKKARENLKRSISDLEKQ